MSLEADVQAVWPEAEADLAPPQPLPQPSPSGGGRLFSSRGGQPSSFPFWGRAGVGAAPAPTAAQRFTEHLARNDCAAFALAITDGLHEGARLRERRCLTIGSSLDDDLVLRDPGVDPGHAEIARLNGAWALLCAQGPSTRALAPLETQRRGRCLRQRFELGGASLVLTQVLMQDPVPAEAGPRAARRRLAWAGACLALALVGGAAAWWSARPGAVPALPAARSLVAEGWPDVQLVPEPGGLVARGYVDDPAQLERLHQWLDAQQAVLQQQRRTLVRQLHTGSEAATLVREALSAGSGVSVDYIGAGRVRVQGAVSEMGVRERLRRVAQDLAGVVQVDDRLAVVDTQASAPRMRPLPFRILDVVPGPNGYFRADTGARYFVGAVLGDGAEVVAISSEAIEFQLGDRQVVYPLK